MARSDIYDPPEYQVSFLAEDDRPLLPDEQRGYSRALREERRRERRERQHAEDVARFHAEDAERVRRIELGEDPRQPPEYRGRTWEHPTRLGIAHLAVPPMRTDPQAPPTEEFTDFQMYNGLRMRAEHPDWYCADCGIRYAPPPICTHCGSARHDVLRAPTADGHDHRCRACTKTYTARPPICGPCIDKHHPDLVALATAASAAARARRKTQKKGSGMADGVYPL